MAKAKTSSLPDGFSQDWLERLDKRSTFSRAVLARFDALTADLGGRENLSYQRLSLAKRAIYVEAVIEQQEARLARGEDVDLGKVSVLTNSLVGLLKTLGLDRVARETTLADYLARREATQ